MTLALAPLAHATASSASRSSSSSSSSVAAAPHVAAREHDVDAARPPCLCDDVDRSRLELDEEDLRVDGLELLGQSAAVGEVAGDVHDVGAVRLRQVLGEARVRRLGGRREERDLPSATGSTGRGQSVTPTTRGPSSAIRSPSSSQPEPSSAIVSTTRSESSWR